MASKGNHPQINPKISQKIDDVFPNSGTIAGLLDGIHRAGHRHLEVLTEAVLTTHGGNGLPGEAPMFFRGKDGK